MRKSNVSGKTERTGKKEGKSSKTSFSTDKPKRSYKKSDELKSSPKTSSFKKNSTSSSEKPFAKFRPENNPKRIARKNDEGGDFKPYSERNKGGFSSDDKKRPFRKNDEGGEFKPYSERNKGGFSSDDKKRPFRKNDDGGDFKPYSERNKGGFSADDKKRPFRKNDEGGEFKPYSERNKSGFSADDKKRPFRKNDEGGDFKPYSERNKGGFSADDKKRPFRKNDEGGEFKPYSERNKGGFSADDKKRPFRKNDEGGEFKPYSERNKGGFTSDRDNESTYERPKRKTNTFSEKEDKKPFPGRRSKEKPTQEPPSYQFKRPRGFASTAGGKRPRQFDKSKEKNETDIRLNRYIANSGVCSRREADELIASGQITVNNKVVTEMGYKVAQGDVVRYGKKILNPEKLVYVLLNKPKDYITTTEDPEERKTVMDLVKEACQERIYPVGRLDRNTTGLLLLTNDGELAERLSHPSHEVKKIYHVELDSPFQEAHYQEIMNGFNLEDGPVKVDDLGILTPDALSVGIEIHSGRNRIVRRIFEHFGYEVLKLDRTVYAGITKKDLPRGMWRYLTEKELIRLKYML
ncbi:MAG: pseudouridine synthase [Spirosomataceae bacterium]